MPRNAPRQGVNVPQGQGYGMAQEQAQAQADLPLPDMRAAGAGGGGAPSPAPARPTPADPAAVLAAAQGMTAEPPPWAAGPMDEQITAGLPSGPGPGPEALGPMRPRRTGVAEMLRRVAETTGNPYYAELAQDEV